MSSIVLTNIWLCLGRKRLFRRTAPIVLVFGLAVGLIVCWIEEPRMQSSLIPGIVLLTLGMMLPLILMRWAGVRFQNTKLDSLLQFNCQPGAGVGPPRIGGASRYTEDFCALGQRQTSELPQLDEFGQLRLLDR